MHKAILKIFLGIICLAFAIVGAWGIWLRLATIPVEYAAHASAMAYTDQLLQAGANPEDWDTRVFLPMEVIRAAAKVVEGAEFIVNQGEQDKEGRYVGAFVTTVQRLAVKSDNSQISAEVQAILRYKSDRESPWWRGATASITIRARFLPVPGDSKTSAQLRIAPVSVEFRAGWNPFAVATSKFISEALAQQIFQGFSRQLYVPVPPLTGNLKFDLKIDKRERSRFNVEGGYDLVARLNGPTLKKAVTASYPLITSAGVWMLGGKQPVFSNSSALPDGVTDAAAELTRRFDRLSPRLRPFETTTNLVEVRISNKPIMELVAQVAGPAGNPIRYVTDIRAENASGVIAEAHMLKANLLGDVGVKVTPQHAQFASGSIVTSVGPVAWLESKGLSAHARVSANARAAVHYHISTGKVGGGVGGDTTLEGSANGNVDINIEIAKRTTPAGDAIVLIPIFSCSRIEVDVYSQAALLNAAWVKVGRLGVRIKRNIGGGEIPPTIILDSLPRLYSLAPAETERRANAAAREDIRFSHRSMMVTWAPKEVLVEKDGIRATAAISIKASDEASEHLSTNAADELDKLLRQMPPSTLCPTNQELALLVDNQEIGPNGEVMRFVGEMIKAGKRVAEETKKEFEKLKKDPVKSITDAPRNIVREISKIRIRL